MYFLNHDKEWLKRTKKEVHEAMGDDRLSEVVATMTQRLCEEYAEHLDREAELVEFGKASCSSGDLDKDNCK